MPDLFDYQNQEAEKSSTPLPERLRAHDLKDFVGQEHLLGEGAPLRKMIENDEIPSMILWGPAGSGKTTLAHVIAHATKRQFHFFSAVLSGVKEVREIIEKAQNDLKYHHKRTILFVDEIHRFNKAQQDAFLPHIEKGTVTLIGATTENPSFEVIGPLLSRTKVFVLKPLSEEALSHLLDKALTDTEKGLGELHLTLEPEARALLLEHSEGDARRMLNTLEIAVSLLPRFPSPSTGEDRGEGEKTITRPLIEDALQKKSLLYDKKGEEHYNVISCFIKSMRGSDPDAAVYWLARMLEAGEEPLFVARRMVIFASEDIGNADPQAIQVAIAAMQAFDFVGMPEGWIPLAQAATYLASAPKSNASYKAYLSAKQDLNDHGSLPTPLHIRNAPTKLMKDLNYGKGYKYPHDYEKNVTEQQYLPDALKDRVYYYPTENGYEKVIQDYLNKTSKKKR
ncbi:MAG: replication-associated recombination protein A [bacterium]